MCAGLFGSLRAASALTDCAQAQAPELDLPEPLRDLTEIQARASEFAFVHTAYDDSDRTFERIAQVERPRALGVAQIANGFDGEPHYRGILADDGRLVVILLF